MKKSLIALWDVVKPRIKFNFSFYWHPIFGFKRWLKLTTCEKCQRKYKDLVEGCWGSENLCGNCLRTEAKQN